MCKETKCLSSLSLLTFNVYPNKGHLKRANNVIMARKKEWHALQAMDKDRITRCTLDISVTLIFNDIPVIFFNIILKHHIIYEMITMH